MRVTSLLVVTLQTYIKHLTEELRNTAFLTGIIEAPAFPQL